MPYLFVQVPHNKCETGAFRVAAAQCLVSAFLWVTVCHLGGKKTQDGEVDIWKGLISKLNFV